jgi:programmed cell death 6-interacting protein
MAVAKVPKEVSDPSDFIGDNAAFGRPLFAQLVPFSVHVAASIYEERRDRLVNTKIIDELETLTTKIHDTLRSLNLPGSLQALEKPLGLPSSLLSHAEEIRQADALTRLQRSFADTAKLKASDEAMLSDGRDILHAEAAEDNRLRIKYGTERWNRPDSQTAAASLYRQIGEVEGFMKSAANSDELVKTKYKDSEDMLRLLSGNDRDLGNFVPSSRRVTILPKLETESSRLRECLNDLSRVENRRRRKIESVREKAKRDDINSSILAEAARLERNNFVGSQVVPADFEAFFEQRLARYDADLDAVRAEEHDQEEMLSQVESINASFTAAKRGDTSSKDRERALQKLENAYFKYKEIISNLEVGRKFYNDLSKIVGRFRDDCSSFSFSRSSEAAQLES